MSFLEKDLGGRDDVRWGKGKGCGCFFPDAKDFRFWAYRGKEGCGVFVGWDALLALLGGLVAGLLYWESQLMEWGRLVETEWMNR